jgi:Glycosyltransferase family 92
MSTVVRFSAFCLLLWPHSGSVPSRVRACVCQDVREWVEHHVRMGAGKIYIIDHGSTVPVQDSIQDYIYAGTVDYAYVTVRRT